MFPRPNDPPDFGASPHRSYQMPVRDEESESQRKARSRLMRQSRRPTQVRELGGIGVLGGRGGSYGPGLT